MPTLSFLRWRDRHQSSGSSSSQSTRGPAVVEPPAFPLAGIPERLVDETTLRSYEASALGVGYSTSGLLRLQIVDFLATNSISVFDFDATYRWLSYYPRDPRGHDYWGWKLIRDNEDRGKWSYGWVGGGAVLGPIADGYGTDRSDRFKSLLPLPVLEVVATLSQKFGEAIEFYASDRNREADHHFIMVLIRKSGEPNDQNCFIFDSWVGGSEDITTRGTLTEPSVQ